MSEPIDPGGSDPAPVTTHADQLPTGGHSITAARALSAPATVNRAARTVEVVWSTGARARNFVPPLGLITEELDMSPNAVRMQGLRDGGAPVLNTHRSGDARDVVGRVLSARLEAGRGIATLQFSALIIFEATLSFLGLGIQPPTPSLGGMMPDGVQYIASAWWVITFPGLAVLLTTLGLNLMSDGLRQLLDPRLQTV